METQKKLNVIYLSFNAFPGRGTHTIQIMNMCSAFSKIQDITVTLVTSKQSDSRLDDVKTDLWSFYGLDETFKILFTPDRSNLRNRNTFLVKFYRLVLTFFYALNVMRKVKDDFIVYSRAPRIMGILSYLLKLMRIKNYKGFFLELHDMPKSYSPMRKAKGVIVISNALKKDLLKKFTELKEDKIFVAHDGVNINHKPPEDTVTELRKKLGLPIDKKIITYTGRIIKGKGADVLIKAFAGIKETSNIFLLLVGKVYDNYYFQLANELNIRNIKYTGFVQPAEVANYLYCSDILVLPSTEELPYAKYTSPLKLFEYLAAGKPIVVSSLESVKEIIRHEVNGLIYESEDVDSLAQSLNYLLLNEKKANSLAKKAHADAVSYCWKKRAEGIYKFILTRN